MVRVFVNLEKLTPTIKETTKEGAMGSRYKDFDNTEASKEFVQEMMEDDNCLYFTFEKDVE